PDWPLRSREHGPGRLVDRARPPAAGNGPSWRRDLPPRRALRPDPRRLRAPLARLAQPGRPTRLPGNRGRARGPAGLLACEQAPRVATGGPRLRARVPPLPTHPVADAERVPPGRPRLPAPALRRLVSRRGPAAAVRTLRAR